MTEAVADARGDGGLPAPAARPPSAASRLGLDRVRVVRALMLLPVVLLFLVFFVWPLVEILLRSVDVDGRAAYFGTDLTFGYYSDLLSNETLRRIFIETFEIALLSTLVTALIGLPTAYLLTRVSRRLAVILLLLLMLPFWVSIVVRLFSLMAVLGQKGVINKAAEAVGLGPYSLLFNTTSTVIGMVIYLLPYMVLLLYAGMSGVDHSLVTAARTLGASRWRAFTSVYVPLVRGAAISAMLLIFVLSIGFYLTPKILGGPENATAAIYIQTQISNFDWGGASATGVVLLLITVTGYIAALRFGAGRTGLSGSHGAGGKGDVEQERLRFGPTSVLLWAVTIFAVVLLLGPLLVVARASFDTGALLIWPPEGWTLGWFSSALSDPAWTKPLWKSLVVASATAAISTVAALVMARAFNRVRSARAKAAVEALVLTPLIVPIILLGVGLYSVEARLGLEGTHLGLIVAHAVLAIPISFVILAVALARIDPSHESAAWTLGASRSRAFWTVVAPRIAPAMIGAFVSAFVISWDEAIVAFFLTGFDKTLPVAIFSELTLGGDPALAAIATFLIGIVLAGLFLGLVGQAVAKRLRASREPV